LKAIVLAAGRGERMRPLTDALPKPLLPVAGKPLIAWHLEALARCGVRDVVVNLSWLGESLRTVLGDGSAHGVHIHYSEEGPEPLETGGGIFHALARLGPGPFLVVNGDIWTDYDFARLALADDAEAHLVLVPNPPHHPRGDFTLIEGFAGDGSRPQEAGASRLTYSGIGVYRPEFFAGCSPGRFPLLPLLRRAIAVGRLRAERFDGDWQDVGTPERLAILDARVMAASAAAARAAAARAGSP